MVKSLVIVESPTKAKTLKQFLGKDFVVESSVGHIRDLPANASEIPESLKKEKWARLGVNVEEDFKPLYVVQPPKKKKITELKRLLKTVDQLLLATDEDREGEAISWHLLEVLKPKVPVKRMVFHEITKQAILHSLENTREINEDLVNAQEARRIIDRLYGYEVSPILWRKVAPRLSAGRVQSVATRMIVTRERARMRFKRAEYWDLTAEFRTDEKKTFDARLVSLDAKRLATGKDFDPDTGKLARDGVHHLEAAAAAKLRADLEQAEYRVLSAEEKPFSRSPAAPFTTSTLQQEGSRKHRFDAKRTMRAAQRLYESGYITYMRTDSVILSDAAIQLARGTIEKDYGADYLPDAPRTYKNKVKNAQEAHEAIRPAGDAIASVADIQKQLGADEAKVYDLIAKRTLASQMKDARGRRMTVRVGNKGGSVEAVFQATGTVIDFHGFLRAYVEGSDDDSAPLGESETLLPPVKKDDPLDATRLDSEQHFTTPPARLTEATLVKALEESGIGRPSTYASIIDTIQRREYTFKKGTALVPSFTAFAVVALMEQHLGDLIDPEFTARMEDRLDGISRGEEERIPYLRQFYEGNGALGLRPLVDQKTADIDARDVCSIPLGKDDQDREIIVRVGRYGPFLQRGESTAPIPDQTCPDELTIEVAGQLLDTAEMGDQPFCHEPDTGLPIYVKTGRYGPYVQVGDPDPDDKKKKPKMVSLLKGMTPETLTEEEALKLASLPRTLGQDAEGNDVVAHLGRYGPYIKRGSDTRSLTADDDILEVGLPRALELLAQEKKGRGFGRQAKAIKVFEKVEALGGVDLKLLDGRYGPYVSDGEVNASLPKDHPDPTKLELADALALLEAQRERKGKKKKTKKKVAKKKKATKKAAKKTTKKKATKKAPSSKAKATKKTSSS